MGVAAYNRGSKAITEGIERDLATVRNTLDARAALWRKAMEQGVILTFATSGGVLTCGRYQAAVGPCGFAAFRYWRGREVASFEGRSAWSVALWVIENIGRRRPVRIAS